MAARSQRLDTVSTPGSAPPLSEWIDCAPLEQAVSGEKNVQLKEDGNEHETNNVLDGSANGRVNNQSAAQVPQFMEGVPGVVYLQDASRAKAVRQKCKTFCGWKRYAYAYAPLPVSMNLDNVNMIAEQPYRVSWKADGVRYMLLIEGEKQMYFLDGNNRVFQVEGMHFPHVTGNEAYTGAHLTDTLLDGEMVLDRVDAQTTRAVFLVRDIVHWMNEDTRTMNFDIRCRCIKFGIVEPRNWLLQEGVFDENAEPFSIRQQESYLVKIKDRNGFVNMAATFLEEKFLKPLTHDVDGLVFKPYDMAYIPGRCDKVLKWKPPSRCTIDFRLCVETQERTGETASGKLFVGEPDEPFGELKWSPEYNQLNGKIIECRYDHQLKKWIFERIRTDKKVPNHHTTAKDIFKGIERPLTQEILLNYINISVPYFEDKIQTSTSFLGSA